MEKLQTGPLGALEEPEVPEASEAPEEPFEVRRRMVIVCRCGEALPTTQGDYVEHVCRNDLPEALGERWHDRHVRADVVRKTLDFGVDPAFAHGAEKPRGSR